MRAFQETVTANLNSLLAAQSVVDKVLRNIGDSLARSAAGFAYGTRGQVGHVESRGQVISVAFDRKL
jgi:hypothetical protein